MVFIVLITELVGLKMTRINLIPPKDLNTKHLVAEYREIARLPDNLKKSLNRKTKPFNLTEIPQKYTLGTGHVKFFYDKMLFLQKRFESLVNEMLRRGYNPNFRDSSIFIPENPIFFNDYIPNEKEIEINRSRINDRLEKMNNRSK
jgi:deoxyribonuclease (pyrimidine dimer)